MEGHVRLDEPCLLVDLAVEHRATLQWDANGDGYLESTVSDPSAPATGPLYLKLVRDGDAYTGYWSSDGSGWHRIGGPVTVPGVAGSQDAGMIWSSHNSGVAGTATFDSFSVSGPSPGRRVAGHRWRR